MGCIYGDGTYSVCMRKTGKHSMYLKLMDYFEGGLKNKLSEQKESKEEEVLLDPEEVYQDWKQQMMERFMRRE